MSTPGDGAWNARLPPRSEERHRGVVQAPLITPPRSADLAPRRSVLAVGQAGGARSGQYVLVADSDVEPAGWTGRCSSGGEAARAGEVVDDGRGERVGGVFGQLHAFGCAVNGVEVVVDVC